MVHFVFGGCEFRVEVVGCACFAFFVEFEVSRSCFAPQIFDCELLAAITPYVKYGHFLHFRPQFVKLEPDQDGPYLAQLTHMTRILQL